MRVLLRLSHIDRRALRRVPPRRIATRRRFNRDAIRRVAFWPARFSA